MKKEPEPEPEAKDEFTDLFDLAKSALTAKPQAEKKTTPFDEELFPRNGMSAGLGPAEDKAAELFGGVQSQNTQAQNFSVAMDARTPLQRVEVENFPPLASSQPVEERNVSEQGNDVNVFDLF